MKKARREADTEGEYPSYHPMNKIVPLWFFSAASANETGRQHLE